jgi:hypothetical protein
MTGRWQAGRALSSSPSSPALALAPALALVYSSVKWKEGKGRGKGKGKGRERSEESGLAYGDVRLRTTASRASSTSSGPKREQST